MMLLPPLFCYYYTKVCSETQHINNFTFKIWLARCRSCKSTTSLPEGCGFKSPGDSSVWSPSLCLCPCLISLDCSASLCGSSCMSSVFGFIPVGVCGLGCSPKTQADFLLAQKKISLIIEALPKRVLFPEH